MPGRVSRWLAQTSSPIFAAYAVIAAFSTYFCMYAYRKPFAAGLYAGKFWDTQLDQKTIFVVAQVLGYATSKFLGIKIVSELPPHKRAWGILACILAAELCLVGFALFPPSFGPVFLFANGLSLGMVWGLVFGFLEGRKTSDILGVGLAISFIVSSGVVKTVGVWLMGQGVPEFWMPAATGLVFLPFFAAFLVMLAQIPPPTAEDEAQRTKRAPMDGPARRRFFGQYAPGLVALITLYVVLTAYRDFRDNFAREIWDALGFAGQPEILTTAELPVALGALLVVASVQGFKDNRRALLALHGIMLAGAILIGGATVAYQLGWLSPAGWMIAVGLGLYAGYVPFNCVLFDRLIAAVGSVATAGFLIYVADAFGYAGSVGLLLFRDLGSAQLSWVDFFVNFSYFTAIFCAVLYVVAAVYFWRRTARRSPHVPSQS